MLNVLLVVVAGARAWTVDILGMDTVERNEKGIVVIPSAITARIANSPIR